MVKTAVFHKIGEPSEDHMVNSLDQILAFDGQITFDGAYRSLLKYGDWLGEREAIIFVQGNTIGSEGVCGFDEINYLLNKGCVLGWHGWTHDRLIELSDERVIGELKTPLKTELYAYPHGDWDERTAKLVKEMGYLRAYSTTQGEEGNDFAIPRTYV